MAAFQERITQLYIEARQRNFLVGRQAFADQLQVSLGKVSAWIDGHGRPDYETLINVAKNANVSVSWLIGESPYRSFILPKNAESLPESAQDEYKLLLAFIKMQYSSGASFDRKRGEGVRRI